MFINKEKKVGRANGANNETNIDIKCKVKLRFLSDFKATVKKQWRNKKINK